MAGLIRLAGRVLYASRITATCHPALGFFNALNAELNPICHLLALLGARHIFDFSGLRANHCPEYRSCHRIPRRMQAFQAYSHRGLSGDLRPCTWFTQYLAYSLQITTVTSTAAVGSSFNVSDLCSELEYQLGQWIFWQQSKVVFLRLSQASLPSRHRFFLVSLCL